jgi:putative NADH-flavin reductase
VTLAEAMRGQEAVIGALGVGNSLKSSNLIARSMPAIISAMESQGVRRLVFVSAFGVGDTRRDVPLLPRILQRLLLGGVFVDKKAGEDHLRRSGLDWTLVYPSLLTDGPRTSAYRAGERLELRGVPKISRADVAEFCLRQLEEDTYLGKGVLISH